MRARVCVQPSFPPTGCELREGDVSTFPSKTLLLCAARNVTRDGDVLNEKTDARWLSLPSSEPREMPSDDCASATAAGVLTAHTAGMHIAHARVPLAQAEKKIFDEAADKEYLPIQGLESFRKATMDLLLGQGHPAIKEVRAFTI